MSRSSVMFASGCNQPSISPISRIGAPAARRCNKRLSCIGASPKSSRCSPRNPCRSRRSQDQRAVSRRRQRCLCDVGRRVWRAAGERDGEVGQGGGVGWVEAGIAQDVGQIAKRNPPFSRARRRLVTPSANPAVRKGYGLLASFSILVALASENERK
jgi:hypothetical protein